MTDDDAKEQAAALQSHQHHLASFSRTSAQCIPQMCVRAVSVCAGEIKVGIFALKDIPVGEELSYDYQFQHYGLAQAAGDYRSAMLYRQHHMMLCHGNITLCCHSQLCDRPVPCLD